MTHCLWLGSAPLLAQRGSMNYIDTETYSQHLRSRAVRVSEEKLLIARISDSSQADDLREASNCRGYGRIRHFRFQAHDDWSSDPLPIVPALKALRKPPQDMIRAQVFQLAACNWRCWYCFVDDNRLAADHKVADLFTAHELLSMYVAEANPPDVIDLTGGQPDLVPEWTVWMMKALKDMGLSERVFVWADDNLSSRYFWKYLSREQRQLISSYPLYARVACFKGYDEASFSFNTRAAPDCYSQQFAIYKDLLQEGFDMYAYVTFTALPDDGLHDKMERFVDRLQSIHTNLPLRTVPLKIKAYSPTQRRLKSDHARAMEFQNVVHACWIQQLQKRFPSELLKTEITDIPVRT